MIIHLENAIKYSPQGGTIEVVVRPLVAADVGIRFIASVGGPGKSDHDRKMRMHPSVQKTRHMVEICVHDNGIGIPAAHLERIFDRFHRVDMRSEWHWIRTRDLQAHCGTARGNDLGRE